MKKIVIASSNPGKLREFAQMLAPLAIGAVSASFVGTTGASVLLIRPLLRAIAWRRHRVHVVVFFIFLGRQSIDDRFA